MTMSIAYSATSVIVVELSARVILADKSDTKLLLRKGTRDGCIKFCELPESTSAVIGPWLD
jgi:hypothetical protein